METRGRSVVKAVVWNVIGLVTMSLVGLVATGSAALGRTLALVNTGVGLVMYLAYERAWSAIRWGRNV